MFFSIPPGLGFSFSSLPKWLWEDEPAATPPTAAPPGPDLAGEGSEGLPAGESQACDTFPEGPASATPARVRRLVYQGYQWSAQPTWLPMANPVLESWARNDGDAEREKTSREQGARQAAASRTVTAKTSEHADDDIARQRRACDDEARSPDRPGDAAADTNPGLRTRPGKPEAGT